MNITRSVIGSLVILAWTSGAMAIEVGDYKAIRILEPSDLRPIPDPKGCQSVFQQVCTEIGPAYPAGISDQGDVFGHMETNHPHGGHFEQGIRWLRRDNYKGDFLGTFELDPKEWDFCAINGRTLGVHGSWVSPEGIASGRAIPGAYYIDIVSGEVTVVGNGQLEKASGNLVLGELADGETSCSTDPFGYGVMDVSLVKPPFTQENRGEVHRIDPTARALAINDRHVIVGSLDPTCIDIPGTNPLCFGESVAMRIEPTGKNEWSDAIRMDQLGSVDASRAFDLSNTDPGFAVGFSKADDQFEHGVIWNADTGEIIADFGVNSVPHRISSTGEFAVGTRRETFFSLKEPGLWWTEDQWETWDFLSIEDILAALPGGEHWAEISVHLSALHPNQRHKWLDSPIAVNKHGQLLAVGKLDPDAPIESITQWPRAIATGEDCINNDFPCGIPFLLDTLDLDTVLKGDVDDDGLVTNLDITPFVGALAAQDEAAFLVLFPGGNYAAADVDLSGQPNNLDITPFIGLLASAAASDSAAIPEPASVVLLLLPLLAMRRACRR